MNTDEEIATVKGTSYTDSDLKENGTYTYWVVAVPRDGNLSDLVPYHIILIHKLNYHIL